MYKYTLTRVHTQQCTYNTMLYIKWHMRAKNRVRTVIWRSRYSSPHRDLSVCFQGRDDQSICDRWLGLRFTDLKALEFPGGKVSQQRQNPQGEEYGVRKRHGRRQSAEKEAPFRKQAPCDDITKIVKTGNETAGRNPEDWMSRLIPSLCSENMGWKTMGDTLHDHVTWSLSLTCPSLTNQWGMSELQMSGTGR